MRLEKSPVVLSLNPILNEGKELFCKLSIFLAAHDEYWGSLQKSLMVKTKQNIELIPINLQSTLAQKQNLMQRL